MAIMVGTVGKVIGIDHVKELVDWSEKNLRKNNAILLDEGRIKLVVGDGRKGFEGKKTREELWHCLRLNYWKLNELVGKDQWRSGLAMTFRIEGCGFESRC